jgi:hypothetical protein
VTIEDVYRQAPGESSGSQAGGNPGADAYDGVAGALDQALATSSSRRAKAM